MAPNTAQPPGQRRELVSAPSVQAPLPLTIRLAMAPLVDPKLGVAEVDWPYLVARVMDKPPRSEMTMADYAKAADKATRSKEKRARGYLIPAAFKRVGAPNAQGIYPAYRGKANLERVYAIKLDIELTEKGAARLAEDPNAPTHASMAAVQGVLTGFECVIHETRSSTPEAPRFRAFVLLQDGGMFPAEAHRATNFLCDRMEESRIAVDRESSTDLARPMFLPTLCQDQTWHAVHVPGRPFTLGDVPEGYEPLSRYVATQQPGVPKWEKVDLAKLNLSEPVLGRIREFRYDGGGKDVDGKLINTPPRHVQVFSVCCDLIRAGCDDATILRVVADPDHGVSNKPLEVGGDIQGAMKWASSTLAAAHEEVSASRDPGKMFQAVEGAVQIAPPSLLDWLRETLLPSSQQRAEAAHAEFESELPEDRPEGFRERMRRLAWANAQRGDIGFAAEYKLEKVDNEPDKTDLKKEAERLTPLLGIVQHSEQTVSELTDVIASLESGGDVSAVPARLVASHQETFFPQAATPPETVETKRAALAEACPQILASRDVLSLVVDAVHRLGVAGEERAIRALYLMATSRLFERAVQIKVYGESSSGKSFTADCVLLKMLPDGEVVEISNMSPKALIDMEDLRHKILYMVEGTLLQTRDLTDEKALMIRELISRGYLVHHRDVRDPLTQQFHTETIRREGPISFVTTSTGVLHPEVETRLITVHMDASETQNRAVLRSMAKLQGEVSQLPELELSAWHSYQEWLALGPKRVHMPFLSAVSELMGANQARVRRDFKQLILLARAHAVIHQQHRDVGEDGRIVATLDDYEVARDILVDMMARAEGFAVSEGVRQLVALVRQEAVQQFRSCPSAFQVQEGGPTYEQLKTVQVTMSAATQAQRLKVSRASAIRSAKEAISGGFLANHEPRPRQPMRLSLDVPVPDTDDFEHVLPSREQVASWMEIFGGI